MIHLIRVIQFNIKLKLFISLLCILIVINIKAQDIHDLNHSRQFADYLFKTEQYEIAADEYERIVFLDSLNLKFKLKLLKSYRLAGLLKKENLRFLQLFGHELDNLPEYLATEYVKMLLLTEQASSAYEYLNVNKRINPELKQNYLLASLLLQKKWQVAFQFSMDNPVIGNKNNADLHLLSYQASQIKYRKPGLAAMMSAIIPGTGKMYTKNWKDGLIAFAFVGVNAWQAYRGFQKSGKESVYGWVFAGLSFGFYIGNIYGSSKAAKRYNKKIDEEFYHKTRHLVFDNF